MPSIQVTGQLVDPTTGVEGSADIRIASVINYGQTTKKSISHKSTDASGNYDFQLVYGKHLIFVKYEDERIYIPIGYAVVGDSTPDPINLIQLINLSDENPPSELVTELQQLREDTLNDIVDTSAQVLENAGYQGEWLSGTSTALKGETWQVSGRYYVALKDTSVDPINDNENWREDVTTNYVTTAQNDIVGGSIFKGSNGKSLENGDTIPTGTTHLIISVGGNEILVRAWDDLILPSTVTSVPMSINVFNGYDVVTDQGTFEFVTDRVMKLRGNKDKNLLITPQGWGATGNDSVADTRGFIKASEYMQSINGGNFYAPPLVGGSSAYLVDEDIIFGSNAYIVTDAWVKRNSLGTRQFDCMFFQLPGAENVRYERVLLDCNNIPSISGLNLRRNNKGCTVGTARIRNATVSTTLGGGRGLIIEDGVTAGDPKLCAVDTLIVENSFNAFAFNGGTGSVEGDKNNSCSIIDKIICDNVEVPVALYGNNANYPHKGDEMSCIINSLIGNNCGVLTSNQPSSGLVYGIVGGLRASNCQIKSGYIYNDPSYAQGESIYAYRGEYKNLDITMTIDSELSSIVVDGVNPVSFSDTINTTVGTDIVTMNDTRDVEVGYDIDSPSLPSGTTVISVNSLSEIQVSNSATTSSSEVANFSGISVCRDSNFNITVNRDVSNDLFTSSLSAPGHLVNNKFNFSINRILSDRLVPSTINNQVTNYLFLKSKEHNSFVFGKTGLNNIPSGFLVSAFAGYMGQIGQVLISDVNSQPHYLTAATSAAGGRLRIDGNDIAFLSDIP